MLSHEMPTQILDILGYGTYYLSCTECMFHVIRPSFHSINAIAVEVIVPDSLYASRCDRPGKLCSLAMQDTGPFGGIVLA